MTTIRITVEAPDADVASEVKEQFYKKLYEHAGAKVIFEVPQGATSDAEEIVAFAKGLGCEAAFEDFEDPLEDAGGVDFW